MLLVISHRPDDVLVMGPDEALSVDKALFRLLPWMVDLHILIRPTFGELQEWCENWEPHILHYVGHGETTADGRPRLLLYERGMSDATPIDQDDMMNLFRRRVPRLVVLNACRSGQMGSVDMSMGAARATQSFSARLIQKGVLAVIAMQADIKGEDAVALVSDLYRELAKGKPIDQALTLAREHSFANGRNEGKWDWALPALYLAKGVRAEEVLHLDDTEAEPKVFPAIANNYHWLPLSMGVKIHVGREKEQLTLEKKVLAPDLADIAPITLLHGVQDMGKTTMLYWLSEGCARRGRPFIYADFARTSLNYWDVLRLIRDGRLETVSGVALHNHLPLDTDLLFNTFNDALNRKAIEHYAAEHPQQPESSTAVKDEAPDKNPISEMEKQGGVTIFSRVEQGVRADEKNLYETITEEFWSSLARAAEPNGLMIFLDHIDKLFPGTVEIMHKYLIDRLLTANSSSPVSKVRLVLAVRDADLTDVESLFEQNDAGKAWNFLFELAQKDGSQVREVRVEGLPHEQLHWLAQVWARRYFISCRAATPFKRFVDAYLGGRNLEPRHVDAYVKKRVDSYDPVPIAPGRLVTNLLDPQFIKDWLKTL